MLNITCDHIGYGHQPGVGLATISCNQEAEMVLLVAGDETIHVYSACADHAAEEAHEARQCYNDDEYRIVVLSKPTEE